MNIVTGRKDVDKGTCLFVVPWELHHVGGVNEVVKNLYDEFEKENSLKPALLVNEWAAVSPEHSVESGRNTYRSRLRSPIASDRWLKNFLVYIILLPFSLVKIQRFLSSLNVKVINVHYPSFSMLYFVILKILGLYSGRLIVSFHGLDLADARRAPWPTKKIWSVLFKNADAVVGCSNYLRGKIVEFMPEHQEKIVAIHNGVSGEKISVSLSSLPDSFPADARCIVNIATFEAKKGQDVLFKAFVSIAKRDPGAQLIFIGRDGPFRQFLMDSVRKSGIENNVHFYADVPHDVAMSMLSCAEVFCMPSREEPFGISIVEAGILGIPVVATRVGGIVEIIEDRVNGILVDPDDSESLEISLTELLGNKVMRNELALALREDVANRFTWQRAQRQYLELIGSPRL